MSFRTALLSFILFSIGITSAFAQEPSNKKFNQFGTIWHKTEVTELFNEHWGIGGDFVFRSNSEFGNDSWAASINRLSYRPWIHYQISPYARFSISPIGYMQTEDYAATELELDRLGRNFFEYRTTFQFFHHNYFFNKKIMTTIRYRYEWRWQDRPNLDEIRFFQRWRARYRVRYLVNKSSFYEDKLFYLMAANEYGITFGENVVRNNFNQNRLYLGVGYRFLNAMRVEVRYVDRLRSRGSGFEMDHVQGVMFTLYADQISQIGRKSIQQIQRVRFFD